MRRFSAVLPGGLATRRLLRITRPKSGKGREDVSRDLAAVLDDLEVGPTRELVVDRVEVHSRIGMKSQGLAADAVT